MTVAKRAGLAASLLLLLFAAVFVVREMKEARKEDSLKSLERRRISDEEFEAAHRPGPSDVSMPPPSGLTNGVLWKDNWGCEPYRPWRNEGYGRFDELAARLLAKIALSDELGRLEEEEARFDALHRDSPIKPGRAFTRARQILQELSLVLDLQESQIKALSSVLAKHASEQLALAEKDHVGKSPAEKEAAAHRLDPAFAEEVRAILTELQLNRFDYWLKDGENREDEK